MKTVISIQWSVISDLWAVIRGQIKACPHPGPLPQERENHPGKSDRLLKRAREAVLTREPQGLSRDTRKLFLLLGEKVRMRASVSLFILTVSLLFASFADAQPFAIDWFSIDGGGGTSTGGVYAVSGTIGQPDAGVLSGGNYSLVGGFWGIVSAVQTPGAPLLNIEHAGNGVRVFWALPATGFVLDQTATLTGSPTIPWAQVAFPYQTNATHISITVPMPTGNKFYRLRKP